MSYSEVIVATAAKANATNQTMRSARAPFSTSRELATMPPMTAARMPEYNTIFAAKTDGR